MTAIESWAGAAHPVGRQPQFDIGDLIDLSERLADVPGFVPPSLLHKPPAVLATLLMGAELGLGPMQSLRAIHNIDGRIALSAEVARALVVAAGHRIDVIESDDRHCKLRGKRANGASVEVEWTLSMVERAGLAKRQNWVHYPRQMLQARASSELCRLLFPDALAGLEVAADDEELEAVGVESAPSDDVKPRGSKRRANVKAAPLSPPAPAVPEVPLVPDPPESDAGGSMPVPSTGDSSALGDETPPTEPDVEPLADVHEMPGMLPAWQRRLHARVSEVFVGVDSDVRDAFRHAIVAVLTRGRDSGMVQSSSELDEAERMGFDAILNNVEHGACLIGRTEEGGVELRQSGWRYHVTFEPLRVTTVREAG
jgi:hypothetical protein